MQIHKVWTVEEVESLKRDYQNYVSNQELVIKYGRSLPAILSKVYDSGFRRDYPRQHRGYNLPVTRNELESLYLMGKSIKDIALLCGSCESNIFTHLKKLKVKLRKNPLSKKKPHNIPEKSVIEDYLKGVSLKELSSKYGASTRSIKRFLFEAKVSRGFRRGKRRYTYDEHFFDKIDTEEKAYFLGLLYADGSVSKKGSVRLRLHEKDLETVISFSNALKSTYPIKFEASKCPNRGNVYGVTLWCQYLVNILSGLGCVPNKTFKLVFPDFLDPKLYNHFIRGYFDGDGCILRNKKHAFSLVGTESFLLTVKEIMVDTLGLSDLPLKTRHPERNNNIRSLVYSGRKVALKIKDWLYRDATIYMKRKYEIFQSIPTNPKYKRKRNKKIEV